MVRAGARSEARVSPLTDEAAYVVVEPHFDAVRDVFAAYRPSPRRRLKRLEQVRLVVNERVRTSERHYAATRTDGQQVVVAPAIATLPLDVMVAILVHEMGHAADFAYPGRWVLLDRGKPAIWLDDQEDAFAVRKWRKLWHERSDPVVEHTADAIAYTVTGARVGYCDVGGCLLQCFGGIDRPDWLR